MNSRSIFTAKRAAEWEQERSRWEDFSRRFNREFLQGSDSALAEALVDPVIQRFTESLDTVATAHPDLAAHCEALQNNLYKLLDPAAPAPAWDPDDPELPF